MLLGWYGVTAVALLAGPIRPAAGGCGPSTVPIHGSSGAAAPAVAPADSLRLRLNLPSFRLEVYQGATLIRRYRVAIGDTAHPTPIGTFEITRVEWDPWWVPPNRDWAAKDSVTPPGQGNPMGRVKLYWRDMYFLHGTPYRNSLGTPASHGCVRMLNADVTELATLVHRHGSSDVPAGEVQRLAAKRGKTRMIVLQRPVPFEITYDITAVADGQLVIYPDVYRRFPRRVVEEAFGALSRSGLNLVTIDTARVRRVIERAGGKRVSLAIRQIFP
ncbi:MAG: L,D-transpeptidase [Gemmatimonadetes bacterium]|nr:L,D-transpeptidase [Gemmatimonadota bacterium]